MKILVTGGAGFIGSNLIKVLLQNPENEIFSLDNYFTGSPKNHHLGVHYIKGECAQINQFIPFKPDLIYHLGEYSRVESSFKDIEKIFKYNIEGLLKVLLFAKQSKSKIIYSGSSTKFAKYNSKDIISPYAWSKHSNTELVNHFAKWYNLDYAITYLYNVYGENEISKGDYATVIGIFKDKMRLKQPLTVVLPGTQLRNFTSVGDIVSGLIMVGEKGYGDDYGIGHPSSYSIIEIAKLFGGEIKLIKERLGNRQCSDLITSKTSALGWKPTESLPDYIDLLKKRNWI